MRHLDPRPRTPSSMPGPVVVELLVRERTLGTLTRLALSDVLGMSTQSVSPARIHRRYGEVIRLRDAVAGQPITPSVSAGSIMDDTEQVLVLTGLPIDSGGRIDLHQLTDALLYWKDDMCAHGSLDLLGSSIKLALERVRARAGPYCTEREGITNGAAMWVAPIGIVLSLSTDGDTLARAVQVSCLVTHDTRQGSEAAGLLAAAVNAAIDGVDTTGALEVALDFMTAHPEASHWTEKVSVATCTRPTPEASYDLHGGALVEHLHTYVGTSVESAELVPCALVIVRESVQWLPDGLCLAAELGEDINTVAAIADAVLGVNAPYPLPVELVDRVLERFDLRLEPVCDALLALRGGGHCQRDAPEQGRP